MIEEPELVWPARDVGERETLVGMLDFYRTVQLHKAAGLNDGALATKLEPSDLTLGGLVLHMALVEDHWFHVKMAGNPTPALWDAVDWDAEPDWDFDRAHEWSGDQLAAQFAESRARSDAVIAAASLDDVAPTETPRGPVNLRWILVHMIEEYARHCGHADLIRQSIDGQTDS